MTKAQAEAKAREIAAREGSMVHVHELAGAVSLSADEFICRESSPWPSEEHLTPAGRDFFASFRLVRHEFSHPLLGGEVYACPWCGSTLAPAGTA